VTGVLLQKMDWPRLKGRAQLDRGDVVFRCVGIDSTEIFKSTDRAWVDFGRLRTPDDVLHFVDKYGPVGDVPADFFDAGEDETSAISTFDNEKTFREPIDGVLNDAREYERFVSMLINLQRADGGDLSARRRVKKHLDHLGHQLSKTRLSSSEREFVTPELVLTAELDAQISFHLQRARPFVRSKPGRPGRFEYRLVAPSLLSSCYLHAAQQQGSEVEVRFCRECHRIFVPRDPRMKDCEPKCGKRFRKREERSDATRKE
jgi:hypothetical protein